MITLLRRSAAIMFVAMLTGVLLTSDAFAEVEAAAQVSAVESEAASLPIAVTEAQAVQDQAALMPAVVKKAIKAGGRKVLIEHAANNPNVLGDVLSLTKPKIKNEGAISDERKPTNAPLAVRAHAADTCSNAAWGSEVEWCTCSVGWGDMSLLRRILGCGSG